MMTTEEKRGASVLMTSSGRRALRGDSNLWGAIDTEGGEEAAVGALGRKHIRAVQERQGLDSLTIQVTLLLLLLLLLLLSCPCPSALAHVLLPLHLCSCPCTCSFTIVTAL